MSHATGPLNRLFFIVGVTRHSVTIILVAKVPSAYRKRLREALSAVAHQGLLVICARLTYVMPRLVLMDTASEYLFRLTLLILWDNKP